MRVNQLAKALQTTPDTVRYYSRIGLLEPSTNSTNAYKDYGDEEHKRLRFILCARQMGFAVDEIARIFAQAQRGNAPCPQIVDLLEQRLEAAQVRLARTQALTDMLITMLEEWRTKSRSPTGDTLKRLIARFAER
ncbi:MAG: MerR family transcriptional regulator [Cellvibrionaceae bacterium]